MGATTSSKPFLICIDYEGTIEELNKKDLLFAKVEFLKSRVAGMDKGLMYYLDHNNHKCDIPWIWRGILEARTILFPHDFTDDFDKRSYEIGVEQWGYYSKLNQMIFDLQYGSKEKKCVQRDNNKMTIPQLALMHYYKGASLTRDTAKAIAVSNGHTSGDKLYNKWCYYCHKRNRLGIEETEVTNRNKLKMFEAVASVLEGPAKLKALEELKALKEKVANRFPNL